MTGWYAGPTLVKMGIREKFEDRIRKKKEELRELEAQTRDLRVYIEAIEDSLKLLPKEDEEESPGEIELRHGSRPALVRDLLRAAGHPLHIGAILVGLEIENTKANRASVSGTIASYARQGQIFKKVGPNTFGLLSTDGPAQDGLEDLVGTIPVSGEDGRK